MKIIDEFSHLSRGKRDYRRNKEKIIPLQKSRSRAYYQLNKRQAADKKLQRLYGISLEDKENLLLTQGGVCAICKSDNPKTIKGWHVDHNHETSKVRGILCQVCNVKLGTYEKVNKDPRFLNYMKESTP